MIEFGDSLWAQIENFEEYAQNDLDALTFRERLMDLLDEAYIRGYAKAQEDNADAINYYHGTS